MDRIEQLAGKKIIYIEDERAVSSALMRVLRKSRKRLLGVEIALAESYSAGAVLLATAEECDLVITDGSLPGGHGRDLIARFFGSVRCQWIFLTSEADAPDMASFMAGYDDRLRLYGKPILKPQEFVEIVAGYLK